MDRRHTPYFHYTIALGLYDGIFVEDIREFVLHEVAHHVGTGLPARAFVEVVSLRHDASRLPYEAATAAVPAWMFGRC